CRDNSSTPRPNGHARAPVRPCVASRSECPRRGRPRPRGGADVCGAPAEGCGRRPDGEGGSPLLGAGEGTGRVGRPAPERLPPARPRGGHRPPVVAAPARPYSLAAPAHPYSLAAPARPSSLAATVPRLNGSVPCTPWTASR